VATRNRLPTLRYDTRLHHSECPQYALRLNAASRIVGLRSCLELSLAELEGIFEGTGYSGPSTLAVSHSHRT
jgi:hypothetical protein